MRYLLAIALLGGCFGDIAEPQRYTCTVVYRCQGDDNLSAALATPCAINQDEALELAQEAGIQAAEDRCATPWTFVRPSCDIYQPAESCEEAP